MQRRAAAVCLGLCAVAIAAFANVLANPGWPLLLVPFAALSTLALALGKARWAIAAGVVFLLLLPWLGPSLGHIQLYMGLLIVAGGLVLAGPPRDEGARRRRQGLGLLVALGGVPAALVVGAGPWLAFLVPLAAALASAGAIALARPALALVLGGILLVLGAVFVFSWGFLAALVGVLVTAGALVAGAAEREGDRQPSPLAGG